MKKAVIRFMALMLAFVLTALIPDAGMQKAQAAGLITVDELRVTLPVKSISLLPSSTEGQVMGLVRSNVGTTTEGVMPDSLNTWLEYQNGSRIDGVGLGTGEVNVTRNYYIGVTFELESGYCWSAAVVRLDHNPKALSSVSFPVYFNGKKVSNGYISYNSNYNTVKVDIPAANEMSAAKLQLKGKTTFQYDGKKHALVLKSVRLYGKKLPSTCYKVYYTDKNNKKIQPPKKPGSYFMVVEGKGILRGTKAVSFKIEKLKNTMKASGKKLTVNAAALKKKNIIINRAKAFQVTKARGKVTFQKIKGNKRITVAKNGKITVKKGLKKGKYRIQVKVTAAGNDLYKKMTKKVYVTIIVK